MFTIVRVSLYAAEKQLTVSPTNSYKDIFSVWKLETSTWTTQSAQFQHYVQQVKYSVRFVKTVYQNKPGLKEPEQSDGETWRDKGKFSSFSKTSLGNKKIL